MVGENLLSFQQNFWLRLAARADSEDPSTRAKMEALSRAVMTLTETMVKMAEDQLQDSSELVTKILTSAADERGEWELPLAPEQLNALKQVPCTLLLPIWSLSRPCSHTKTNLMKLSLPRSMLGCGNLHKMRSKVSPKDSLYRCGLEVRYGAFASTSASIVRCTSAPRGES